MRVSDDDTRGSQSDYLEGTIVSNNLAVFTPYEVTFRCFSQDLANVLSGFASSPHGFIVRDISVRLAESTAAAPPTFSYGEGTPGGNPTQSTYPTRQPSSASASAGRGGLQTVLKERLLSVTVEIEAVKLLPEI